jgi:phosphatidylserine/phosphatidylglycerophosphate/cardiolipin synthase-like enzyme
VANFVPKRGTGRYAKCGQQFWAGEPWFDDLIEAGYKGENTRAHPWKSIDDLNSLLRDAATVDLRDELLATIDSHPNVEMRLFNPWTRRDLVGRAGEAVGEMARLNQRMHNKSIIVDNQATILGGRNLGDEYLGLNPAFNFHDLDVIGIGPSRGRPPRCRPLLEQRLGAGGWR